MGIDLRPGGFMLLLLCIVAACGSGLIAGVFFAFSSFVMKAFNQLRADQSVMTMQVVNRIVVRSHFIVVFLATAIVSIAILILLWVLQPGAAGELLLLGCVSYLAGAFLVTIVFHVPRNNNLSVINPDSRGAERAWVTYTTTWTAWNHVRTAAASAAMVFFILAAGNL